jgi:hypothetical protein
VFDSRFKFLLQKLKIHALGVGTAVPIHIGQNDADPPRSGSGSTIPVLFLDTKVCQLFILISFIYVKDRVLKSVPSIIIS